jgi:4-amino-4-deoxy-L-arabinose transferase-like glycosyltransferase
MFPIEYVSRVRWIQLILGMGTALLCASASGRAFGVQAGRSCLAIALLFPTLVFVTGEILTECVGAFLAALFLYLMMEQVRSPRLTMLAAMGVVTSVAALFRFNMAALGFVGLWVACLKEDSRPRWQRVLLFSFCAGFVICPWLIRNQIAFHGQVVYSTLSGHDAVEGVLTPQGRALPGDNFKIAAAEGWLLSEVETNNSSRLRLPSEAALNRQAWQVAQALWLKRGLRLIPLLLSKCSAFWLSTDQILWTQAFSLRQRAFRLVGVMIYWGLLGVAVVGWFRSRRTAPALAHAFLFYSVIVTLLHVPFPMISRLRIPFMDPLIAILCGAAFQHRHGPIASMDNIRIEGGLPSGPETVCEDRVIQSNGYLQRRQHPGNDSPRAPWLSLRGKHQE